MIKVENLCLKLKDCLIINQSFKNISHKQEDKL